MIKRSTWILLGILVLVVVAYFVVTNHTSTDSTQGTPTEPVNTYLFSATNGTLLSIRISDQQNNVVKIQRDSSGLWTVLQPSLGTADQSLSGAAETQIGALRILATLDNQLNLADAGLDIPAYTIELTFNIGIKHILRVGTLTPTNSGYYVHYDEGKIYVISKSGIDSLLNLLTSPPFAATETLVPTIELTPIPGKESSTPTLELVTPTP
jgi:hypothetical protein